MVPAPVPCFLMVSSFNSESTEVTLMRFKMWKYSSSCFAVYSSGLSAFSILSPSFVSKYGVDASSVPSFAVWMLDSSASTKGMMCCRLCRLSCTVSWEMRVSVISATAGASRVTCVLNSRYEREVGGSMPCADRLALHLRYHVRVRMRVAKLLLRSYNASYRRGARFQTIP